MKRFLILSFSMLLSVILFSYSHAVYQGKYYDYEQTKEMNIEIASAKGILLIKNGSMGFLSDFSKDTIYIINHELKTVSSLSISVLKALASSFSGQSSSEASDTFKMKPMESVCKTAGREGREYRLNISQSEYVSVYFDESEDISSIKENIIAISPIIEKMQQAEMMSVFRKADKAYLPLKIIDVSGKDTLLNMQLIKYEKVENSSIFSIPSDYKYEQ